MAPRTDESCGPQVGLLPTHDKDGVGHGQGLRGGPGRAGSPDGRVQVCRLPGTLPSICPASPATLTLTGKGRGLGPGVLEAHQGLLRTWLLWSPPSLLLDLLGHPRSRDMLSFLPPRKNKSTTSQPAFCPPARLAATPSPSPRTCSSHPVFPQTSSHGVVVGAQGQFLDLTPATAALPCHAPATCDTGSADSPPPDLSTHVPGGPSAHEQRSPAPDISPGLLMSTPDLAPSRPGLRAEPQESLLPLLCPTCMPSVQKSCGWSRQSISRGCLPLPVSTQKWGPHCSPFIQGRATHAGLPRVGSSGAPGCSGKWVGTGWRLHRRLPQTAWRDLRRKEPRQNSPFHPKSCSYCSLCIPNLTLVTFQFTP